MTQEKIDDIVQKLIALRRDEFANGTDHEGEFEDT
jgi:hypothetical protein